METPDLIPSPELKEVLASSYTTIEVNTYRTRGHPLLLNIDGTEGAWHSLKGGLNPKKYGQTDFDNLSFEILHNPDTKEWLKLVPPETSSHHRDQRVNRLKKSVEILHAALKIAGLPQIDEQIKESDEVMIRGGATYGFISPHFGPTLEYCIKRFDGKPLPDSLRRFLSEAYLISFIQATALYLDYQYWTSDPNPGNILLVPKGDKLQVVTTDFANRIQVKPHFNTEAVPPQYLDRIRQARLKSLTHNLSNLFALYNKHCQRYQLPFFEDLEQLKDHFDQELSQRGLN